MRYSIFAGGKRLRAILVMAAYEAFGMIDSDEVLPIACAVEMIHTYSLIHDDLPCIDNDDYRRGKLTNHKVFGDAIAVLAGDALLTHAFWLISKSKYKNVKSEKIIEILEIIGNAISTFGMIGGQVVDIETSGHKITPKELEYIHVHKTGALLHACVYAGALLANADDEELSNISDYGKNIGLAFQIIDDILDIEGDFKLLGKKAGSDIINQKNTYPSVFGLEKSRELGDVLINSAIEKAKKIKTGGTVLVEIANFIKNRKF